MQTPISVTQKKTVFIEIIILILFLGGMYYLYTQFREPSVTVSTAGSNQALLGVNSTLIMKALTQDKISFQNISSINDSKFVRELQDFSEIIPVSAQRGRSDPFIPYASSRPIR